MSKDIYVDFEHAGTLINGASDIYVQLDNMSQQEAAYYGGAGPFQRFMAYTLVTLNLQQGDLMIDRKNIDPKTTRNARYRIINIPEFYPDAHGEMVVDLVRGT